MCHEVADLVLAGLFCVHLILNRKWIAATVKRGLGGEINARTRVLTVVNALLVVSWIGVLVIGILVSKKVFSFQVSFLIPWHFFVSAVALIITGIHFVLNWKYFWGAVSKKIRLASLAVLIFSAAGIICLDATRLEHLD